MLGALVGLSFLVSPYFHHPGEFFLAVDIVFVFFLLLRGVWLILRYFVREFRRLGHDMRVRRLRPGDEVVTAKDGVVGIVRKVRDDCVVVEIAAGFPVCVRRSEVSLYLSAEALRKHKAAKPKHAAPKLSARGRDVPKSDARKPAAQRCLGLVGLGPIGQTLVNSRDFRSGNNELAAVFDADPDKVGREYAGVSCFYADDLARVIADKALSVVVLAVPPREAQRYLDVIVSARRGIGVLNFSGSVLKAEPPVHVENADLFTEMEKYLRRAPRCFFRLKS